MALTLDWIQLAAVAGALQGVLLTGVLLAQRSNRTANRLLSALIAAFTLYLASSVYYAAGLVSAYPHFFGVAYQMPWLFGPLFYLYAVAASDRSWQLRARDLAHFLPAAINVLVSAPYYVMSGAEKVAMYERLVAGDVPARLAILDPLKYVSGIAYSVATVVHLRRHRRSIEDSYSNTARVNLAWLLRLSAGAAAIWLTATTLRITDFDDRLRDDHVTLGVALFVYAIGYMGLRQPEVLRHETAEHAVPVPVPLAVATPATPQESDTSTGRYERSGLGDREAVQLEAMLRRVMEDERPWKDSELTLPELAARLESTPHKLSEVLNVQIGQTFYDFVNGYRVREVQRRITAGDARTTKMLALALDAGFASKSTFNQAFKKHTSQTPSDFRDAVGA
jgi:AraC-like DNA-binding protein